VRVVVDTNVLVSGEAITARPLSLALPDLTDLPFLEVAIAGAAAALITENVRHFRTGKGSHSVNICTPAEFLTRLCRS
jgi:predicted nucleic acid-binding protein